ncbi:pyridoxamine 5'-phosphate oxidase family protein [Streptomyces sp. SGAir0957]
MTTHTTYHRGELTAQERAGTSEAARAVSAVIRDRFPEAARHFLAEQPMIVVGATDHRGDVWASLLTGLPGFLTVTGPSTLAVAAAPVPGDPLHAVLTDTARVGLIALDPGSRRRMRINGTAHRTTDGIEIEADQIYANCPKYIQKRVARWQPGTTPRPPFTHTNSARPTWSSSGGRTPSSSPRPIPRATPTPPTAAATPVS